MDDVIVFLLNVVVPFGIIIFGYLIGRTVEQNHLRSLDRREADVAGIYLTETRQLPPHCDSTTTGRLVVSSVVLATDPFRRLLGWVRNIFGGEVKTYNRLYTRARREAILRCIEEARDQGYDAIINLRLDTASIGGRKLVMVEIMASGTALRRA